MGDYQKTGMIVSIACTAVCALTFVTPTQIIVIAVYTSTGDDCDEPIRVWLIVFAVHVGVSFVWHIIKTVFGMHLMANKGLAIAMYVTIIVV